MAFAAVAAMTPDAARAGTLAYSYLDIDDFGFGVSTTGGATVSIANTTNLSDLSAHLNGASVSDSGSNPVAAVDVPLQCIPAGCGGILENDFSLHLGAGEFSRADSLLDSPTNLFTPSGANATAQSQQVAETSLVDPGTGSANTRNGLITSFSFLVSGGGAGAGGTFDLSFLANQFLSVLLDDPTGSAVASTAFRVTILDPDGDVAFDWSSNGEFDSGDVTGYIGGTEFVDSCNLNTNISRTNNTLPINVANTGCTYHVNSNLFPANVLFDVSVNSNADSFVTMAAAEVPEPAIPGIFGFLTLFGGLYLKRFRKA